MNTLLAILISASTLALPPKERSAPLPGYDWAAEKKRAPGKPAPPPESPVKIVGDFIIFLKDTADYDEKAESFVIEERDRRDADSLDDFLTSVYPILSRPFADALEHVDNDRIAEAASAFETLSMSDDPYLAVTSANLAATAMIELEEIDRCLAMLIRVRDAHEPIEKYTTDSDRFRFMLGYCQVHNLDYRDAYATFEDFLKNHPTAPERFTSAARQILTELDRRAPGRIGDVRDIMNYARRKLSHARIDDELIDKQYEAIALLDSLIEEAEQQEQQGQGGGDGGGGGQGGQSPGGSKNPGGGAKQSTLPQGEGGSGELRRERAQPGEMWGKIPPRDREALLQTLQKQFPSQYRELLEQYYKQLAKDAPTQ